MKQTVQADVQNRRNSEGVK